MTIDKYVPFLETTPSKEDELQGQIDNLKTRLKVAEDATVSQDNTGVIASLKQEIATLEAQIRTLQSSKKTVVQPVQPVQPAKPVAPTGFQTQSLVSQAEGYGRSNMIGHGGYHGTGEFVLPSKPSTPGGGQSGYDPDPVYSGGSYYPTQPSPLTVNNPIYVESVTAPDTLDQNMQSKMCPVYRAQGMDQYMTAAKLYGARVDINENGIWFDHGELQEIISKLKGGVLSDLGSLVRGWSHDKGMIRGQREKLVKLRNEYDTKYARFLELDRVVQVGGPDKDKNINEYRTLANEMRERAAQLREGIDITPGKTVGPLPTEKRTPGHTDLKFCPVAMAQGESIIMARVKLTGEEIDASEHGLWFDKDELVNILRIVQKKHGSVLDGLKKFLRGQGALDKLKEEVAARIAKVKERDAAHKQLQEKAALNQFGPEYNGLQDKYNRLNEELNRSVDITPRWLL